MVVGHLIFAAKGLLSPLLSLS